MTKFGKRGDNPSIVVVVEIESTDIEDEEDFMMANVIFNHIRKKPKEDKPLRGYVVFIARGISVKGGVAA